jgi:DNA invertase Pin-like site-specific DNA recombinase
MSTDQQEYSIANQQDRIRKYADQHGLKIVRTYSDPGRSGLTIRERKGLAQLLRDVISGTAPFKAICVYDVSRWGRFQDSDESAHYEYLCKKAGVPIHYCAEQFPNDGTMPSAMFKALKRTMAAEYSRELSVRMSASKRRLAAMGFRQGGAPGFGFRRFVIPAHGRPGRVLEPGERKPFVTDRMKLVHGPKSEVALVRRIFKLFLDGAGRIGSSHIASQLNRERLPYINGKRWSNQAVRDMLSNPKYAGINLWGRTTTLLHTRAQLTSDGNWIRVEGAFPAIIDKQTFPKAQQLLKVRADGKIQPAIFVR